MNPSMDNLISSDIEAPVMDVVRIRKSSRAFAGRMVSDEVIRSLFEAARWAPSSRNEQPWKYIYATKDQTDLWERIFSALTEGNKVWVQYAPLLIVSMMRKSFARDGSHNPTAAYDLGCANAFLTLQATFMGLNVRQMAGFHPHKLKASLRIPADYEVVSVMAVGYPAQPDILPAELQQRENAPRTRYRQPAFVMNQIFDD
jgi:nitroreductase